MNEPKLKPGDMAYLTRYALTSGILRVRVIKVNSDGWIYAGSKHSVGKQGGDFHATIEAAQERAREMAKRKLAALDKQRAALEAILRDGAKVIE
jgi:hypothetical protein